MSTVHSHYFKDVSQLSVIDVYRIFLLYTITDPCIQHAVKKLLIPGGRGAGKDISQDIQEAIDSLERWKQMREEENPIYNRRTEDKINVTEYPELTDDADYVEPTECGKTTGKFKTGDKVSIHNVTEVCIPKAFEGAEGVVVHQNEYDYTVEFKYPEEEVWAVYERQVQLVEEAPAKFECGDSVKMTTKVQYVPDRYFENGEVGVISEVFNAGKDNEHFRVSFEDDYFYFNPDEIEHV